MFKRYMACLEEFISFKSEFSNTNTSLLNFHPDTFPCVVIYRTFDAGDHSPWSDDLECEYVYLADFGDM